MMVRFLGCMAVIAFMAGLSTGCVTAPRETERLLAQVTIPDVEFRDANCRDILEFINYSIQKCGPSLESRRVKIVLVVDNNNPALGKSATDTLPVATFKAQKISALKLTKIVAKLLEMEITFGTETVVLSESKQRQ